MSLRTFKKIGEVFGNKRKKIKFAFIISPLFFILVLSYTNCSSSLRTINTAASLVSVPAVAAGGTGSSGFLTKWLDNTNLGNSVLYESAEGNVGIGTTSPAFGSKLEVFNGNINVRSTNGHGYILSDTTAVWKWDTYLEQPSGDYRIFSTAAGGDVVTIKPAGNVGIGTTSPEVKLDILGSGAEYVRVETSNTAGGWAGLWLKSNGKNGYVFQNGTYLGIGAGTSWNPVISIDNITNNVGIGTTSPMASLDVKGDIRLAKNSVAPVSCSTAYDGRIALTSQYTTCVCRGGSSAWVKTGDGTTACVW